MKSKQQIGKEIRHEIDVFFGEREKQEDGISYLDVCHLTDHIEDRFESELGELPKIVEGSNKMARAMLNPSKLASLGELRKALGLLIGAAGGIALIFGILAIIGAGAGVIAQVVAWIVGPAIPVFGPIAIVSGVALVAMGIYLAMSRIPPNVKSAKAHSILIEGIETWQRKDEDLEALDEEALSKAKSKVDKSKAPAKKKARL